VDVTGDEYPVSLPYLLYSTLFLFQGWQSVDALFWLWMVVIAAGASAALSLMARAYQLTKTRYATIYEYAYLISVGLFSWLFWGTLPNNLSIFGILLIIFSGVIIVFTQKMEIRGFETDQSPLSF
jgi:drug/metabolite transporter (DMT)-like permease